MLMMSGVLYLLRSRTKKAGMEYRKLFYTGGKNEKGGHCCAAALIKIL